MRVGVGLMQLTRQCPPVDVSEGVIVKVIGVTVGGGVGVVVTGVHVGGGVTVGGGDVGVRVRVGIGVIVGVAVGGMGVGAGVEVGGGGPGRPIILSRNTAIWPRVLGASGQ